MQSINSNMYLQQRVSELKDSGAIYRVYVQYHTEDHQRNVTTHSTVIRCQHDITLGSVSSDDTTAKGIFEDPQHSSLYGAIEGVAWAAHNAGWNVEYCCFIDYWDNEVTQTATVVVCTKPQPLADRLVAARAHYLEEV